MAMYSMVEAEDCYFCGTECGPWTCPIVAAGYADERDWRRKLAEREAKRVQAPTPMPEAVTEPAPAPKHGAGARCAHNWIGTMDAFGRTQWHCAGCGVKQ